VQESDFTEAAALGALKYLEEDAPDRLVKLADEVGGDLENQTEFWIGYSNTLMTVHGYLLKQRALEAPPSEKDERVKEFCAYLDGRHWVD